MTTSALKSSLARLGQQLDAHAKDAVPATAHPKVLVPYRDQSRDPITEAEILELSVSIQDLGIMQPLLVRPITSDYDFSLLSDGTLQTDSAQVEYEIIAGERRWRAALHAGLQSIPILIKTVDSATVERMHLQENIQRENLSTTALARSVQKHLDDAGGDLAIVAKVYGKDKSWVSKLSSIARGGEAMQELVAQGVTSDRAVLASVAGIERSDPEQARDLVDMLKTSKAKNKRAELEKAVKSAKEKKKQARKGETPNLLQDLDTTTARHEAKEFSNKLAETPKSDQVKQPAWRDTANFVDIAGATVTLLIGVELAPSDEFQSEFQNLSLQSGDPYLATTKRHKEGRYAVVCFGKPGVSQVFRPYRAEHLRLIFVDET